MGGAHDVVATVLERGIEEEAVVLQLEALAVVAEPVAFAEGEQLLTL
jgi:hypothetical protein